MVTDDAKSLPDELKLYVAKDCSENVLKKLEAEGFYKVNSFLNHQRYGNCSTLSDLSGRLVVVSTVPDEIIDGFRDMGIDLEDNAKIYTAQENLELIQNIVPSFLCEVPMAVRDAWERNKNAIGVFF